MAQQQPRAIALGQELLQARREIERPGESDDRLAPVEAAPPFRATRGTASN
jgi:hypothetical protein